MGQAEGAAPPHGAPCRPEEARGDGPPREAPGNPLFLGLRFLDRELEPAEDGGRRSDEPLPLLHPPQGRRDQGGGRAHPFRGAARQHSDLLEMMRWAEDRTAEETTIDFILCLNYGGRAEVLDAVNALVASGHSGPVTEADLRRFFYLPDVPDPDLIVRTSGELRLSNFWLWEAAYSEFYFTDIHWPDFDEAALDAALGNYAGRERRYGGLKS